MTHSSLQRCQAELIRPPAVVRGSVIGICSPSYPAHVCFRDKYVHALSQIKNAGYRVREGSLTRAATAEGYRTGAPRDRAAELMELFLDPEVKMIISTIGGANSSSLIPYLDFDVIRKNPKVFCGYSDVTSLHLAILAYSGLSTFYGPAVVPSFGEWPTIVPETLESLVQAIDGQAPAYRELATPSRFSRQFRDAKTDAWKTGERAFETNPGLYTLRAGKVRAPCIAANLNTLVTAAGTSYFPNLSGRLLILEEMNAPLSEEERDFRHLERLGVFEEISGLLVGKPERYDDEGAPFSYAELVDEIVPSREGMPIVMDFDCGHTTPMHCLAQETLVYLDAPSSGGAHVYVCERMVS